MSIILPTKYEKLSQNTMVIGAAVIGLLKKQKYPIEELYQVLKKKEQINLERFYNTLTFLWISEVITSDGVLVSLKK